MTQPPAADGPELVGEGIQQVVEQSKRLGLTWTLRQAAVTLLDPLTAVYDGDTVGIQMISVIGTPLPVGMRVMAVQLPTGGNFIIGIVGHPWTRVVFATGWEDQAAFGPVCYRMNLLGQVELSGVAGNTVPAAAPSTIFTLPEGYRPDRRVRLTGNEEAATNATVSPVRGLEVLTTGEVRVTFYAGTVDPGPISFEGKVFALRTGFGETP